MLRLPITIHMMNGHCLLASVLYYDYQNVVKHIPMIGNVLNSKKLWHIYSFCHPLAPIFYHQHSFPTASHCHKEQPFSPTKTNFPTLACLPPQHPFSTTTTRFLTPAPTAPHFSTPTTPFQKLRAVSWRTAIFTTHYPLAPIFQDQLPLVHYHSY